MGKVEVKQTPRRLNPYGEKLVRTWYDDDMPPKNYIWYKDEEYLYWDGHDWVPCEFDINEYKKDHHCKRKCCYCDYDAKFEKFKKDTLAAVLKLIKGQNPDSTAALVERIEALEADVNTLKQINHDLFVKNTELDSLIRSLGYVTVEDVQNMIENFDNRITANENNIRNINSRLSVLENADYITSSDLDGYATEEYVNNAISNINIPSKLSDLQNDQGFVSGVEINYHDEDPEDLRTLSNNDVVNIIEDVEYDSQEPGIYKMYVSMYPYKVNINTPSVEPYDDSEVRGLISNVSEDINDVDDRVSVIEEKYMKTDEEGLTISSSLNDLNDRMAPKEWVEQNYEPKFTDLTDLADPVAEAQSHVDDNKVYITRIEQE